MRKGSRHTFEARQKVSLARRTQEHFNWLIGQPEFGLVCRESTTPDQRRDLLVRLADRSGYEMEDDEAILWEISVRVELEAQTNVYNVAEVLLGMRPACDGLRLPATYVEYR